MSQRVVITETKTVSDKIVNFQSDIEYPFSDVSVAIDPVQDLHGYDNPWPPGGGKNKLPYFTSRTHNGVEWTVNEQGIITANGTSTAVSNCFIGSATTSADSKFDLPNGEYILSGGLSDKIYIALFDGDITGTRYNCIGSPVNVTITQGYATVRVVALSGIVTDGAVLYPMLRLATEQNATYAPYSNECPISGWTEVKAEQKNKNLWPGAIGVTTQAGITFTVNDDGSVTCSGTATRNAFSNVYRFRNFKPGTYKKSPGTSGIGIYIQYEIASDNWPLVTGGGVSSDTFTLDANMLKKYAVIVRIRVASGTDLSTPVTFYPYFYLGTETDLTWVSPKSRTYTIQLGDTVYGGTLDATTGKLTVDRVTPEQKAGAAWRKVAGYNHIFYVYRSERKKFGTLQPSTAMSNIFPTVTANGLAAFDTVDYGVRVTDQVYVVNKDCSTLAEWNAFVQSSGFQLTYELATPIEIQLDPVQIATLKGVNNVWVDAGDITATYSNGYYIDYISKVIYGDKIILDLTSDNIIESKLLTGYTAHRADGEYIEGSLLWRMIIQETLLYLDRALINQQTLNTDGSVTGTTLIL